MATNDDWLALVQEDTIDPERPICDPHHHLGVKRKNVEPTYLLDEILVDINSGHNVLSTVFIETSAMFKPDGPEVLRPVGEVEFTNGIAAMAASGVFGPRKVCAGIIGYANLRLGAAAGATLDAQIQAGGGRFKGIRFGAVWHADPKIDNHRTNPSEHQLLEPAFREGFAELGKRGLSFEGWIYHTQFADLIDLARAFPDTTIILNHFGGPIGVGPYRGKRDEVFAEWKIGIAELATCPNVHAKLGGLQMVINGFDWHKRPKPPTSQELMDATRAYHEHTMEVFGVERCMFESNFPVDKMSCSYNVLWNSFKRMTADYSEAEKNALFHDNASRVYRL
ncbi:MAG: amidohydrolase family protein [Proteobacteria bacterium]|nr:amidohydrolase family protein [Pseudomonadota bacterium]